MAVLSYLFLIVCFIIQSQANINADINYVPVAYCLNDTAYAYTQPTKALYFEINACSKGIANQQQAELSISLPDNINWNTSAFGYVVVQVSKCKDSFESKCVFAQNYKYSSHPAAVPAISWNISLINATTYYLRVMAIVKDTSFSMELSFGNDYSGISFPWTTDSPFQGTIPNTQVQDLAQYWRADAQYQVPNTGYVYFNLAYCPQSNINGIGVATSTLPNAKKEYVSIIHQFACSQAKTIDECTPAQNDWDNYRWAGFDYLSCRGPSTANGIHVIVQGGGDETINFILTATTF